MNVALLLSGGVGTRLGANIPKQYLKVNGKMIVSFSLETMAQCSDLDEIYIVAEESWRESILKDIGDNPAFIEKMKGFAAPGDNRQGSILNGLKKMLSDKMEQDELNLSEHDAVFVHDAARPLLTQELIHSLFGALGGHDGVMPVLPVKDTLYMSDNGRTVSKLLDRDKIFAGQAPEIFLLKKYYQANMALSQEQLKVINGSSEPAILAGMDIVMIPGDENNFKITTQTDLERFQNYCTV